MIDNKTDTKFGIASGSKLFTAIGILQLIDKGVLSLDTHLKDCLDIPFPNFDPAIKIRHLLTHISGIPDYFGEETMDDFSVLWESTPMYKIRNLEDFLPMFREGKMDFKPGERFKSNIYSIPVIGGSDGGAFTTTNDLAKLWKALLNYELLSEELTVEMLKEQIHVEDDCYYGYGIWLIKKDDKIIQYYIVGEDPGVTMISSVYPEKNVSFSVLANTEYGTWDISGKIEEVMKLK